MNRNCPCCESDLTWKFILTSKTWEKYEIDGKEYRRLGKCPVCKNIIGINVHPNEEKIRYHTFPLAILAIIYMVLNVSYDIKANQMLIYTITTVALAAVFVTTLLTVRLRVKIPNTWPRYTSPNKVNHDRTV